MISCRFSGTYNLLRRSSMVGGLLLTNPRLAMPMLVITPN